MSQKEIDDYINSPNFFTELMADFERLYPEEYAAAKSSIPTSVAPAPIVKPKIAPKPVALTLGRQLSNDFVLPPPPTPIIPSTIANMATMANLPMPPPPPPVASVPPPPPMPAAPRVTAPVASDAPVTQALLNAIQATDKSKLKQSPNKPADFAPAGASFGTKTVATAVAPPTQSSRVTAPVTAPNTSIPQVPPPPPPMPSSSAMPVARQVAPTALLSAIQSVDKSKLKKSPERPSDLAPAGAALLAAASAKPLAPKQPAPTGLMGDLSAAMARKFKTDDECNKHRKGNVEDNEQEYNKCCGLPNNAHLKSCRDGYTDDAWSATSSPALSRSTSAANKYHKSKITMKGGFYNY